MYFVRTEIMVRPGAASEVEKLWPELFKGQKGLQLAILGNSLGYPAKYVSGTRWDSREAFLGFYKSAGLQAQYRSMAELITFSRPQEAYEQVFRVGSPSAPGSHAVLIDWTVNPGNGPAFESNRKELFELRQKHGKGFGVNTLWRFLGSANRYLITQAWNSREEAQAAAAVPEVAAFIRAHPYTEFGNAPGQPESYAVVNRLQP